MYTKYQWYSSVEEVTHFGESSSPSKFSATESLDFLWGHQLKTFNNEATCYHEWRVPVACHCYGVKAIFESRCVTFFPASRWCGFLHWKPSTETHLPTESEGRSLFFQVFWPLKQTQMFTSKAFTQIDSSGNRFGLDRWTPSFDGWGGWINQVWRKAHWLGSTKLWGFQQKSPVLMTETCAFVILALSFLCFCFPVKLHVAESTKQFQKTARLNRWQQHNWMTLRKAAERGDGESRLHFFHVSEEV